MKKILSLIIICSFVLLNQAEAKIFAGGYDNLPSKKFSVFKFDKEKREVVKFLNDMNKYANKKDIEAVKKMYDKNYMSSDGFDYETYMKITKETFDSYPDIKYKSRIDDIVITGNRAVVKMSDYTTASLSPDVKSSDKTGKLESICKYTTILTKDDEGWKVLYDTVEFEESALKYGDAKDIDINFDTPNIIEPNKDYTLSLTVDYPKGLFLTASICNEEIIYPDKAPDESFRKIKRGVPLERIVRSNKNNRNEYAIASIGVTRVSVKEDKDASLINFAFNLSGMAFIMRRVNVLDLKTNIKVEAND